MKGLVANLGSTSFKYRLFDLPEEGGAGGGRELARGGVERIGAAESRVYASLGSASGSPLEALLPVRDFKARHASTLLTFDAVADAVGQIEAKQKEAAHG